MRIDFRLDADLLAERYQQGNSLYFHIAWRLNTTAYPAAYWTDFGTVIMGWWIGAIVKLLNVDDRTIFSFMDSPYSIQAKYQRETRLVTLEPEGLQAVWNVPIGDLITEFTNVANQIHTELEEQGCYGADHLDQASALLGKKWSEQAS